MQSDTWMFEPSGHHARQVTDLDWAVFNKGGIIGAIRKTGPESEFQGFLGYHHGELIGQYKTIESAVEDIRDYHQIPQGWNTAHGAFPPA